MAAPLNGSTQMSCPTSSDALFYHRLQLRRARIVADRTDAPSFVWLRRVLSSTSMLLGAHGMRRFHTVCAGDAPVA